MRLPTAVGDEVVGEGVVLRAGRVRKTMCSILRRDAPAISASNSLARRRSFRRRTPRDDLGADPSISHPDLRPGR